MNERQVRIRVSLPFQRATPSLRCIIRENVERLRDALIEEGHEVDAEVHEDINDQIYAKWFV